MIPATNTRLLCADSASITEAALIIKNGGLVGFPTETVYGLGANALDSEAVRKIFLAKGRPQDNPLIVHICQAEELSRYGEDISDKALALAARFWPGPLTMVVKCGPDISPVVTCGLNTVGIRCPSNQTARALIEKSGLPIAAPSANLSGRPSPTTAQHVYDDMCGRIPLILDGGACEVGVESTVISMATEPPLLLRPGIISKDEIEAVIGPIELSPAISAQLPDDCKVQSPGMKYRHYAPRCPVTVVKGDSDKCVKFIRGKADADTGILCFDGEQGLYPSGKVLILGREDDPLALSHNIFSALRKFDDMNVKAIYARCTRSDGEYLGVYNRLMKSAGFNCVTV